MAIVLDNTPEIMILKINFHEYNIIKKHIVISDNDETFDFTFNPPIKASELLKSF